MYSVSGYFREDILYQIIQLEIVLVINLRKIILKIQNTLFVFFLYLIPRYYRLV